MSYAILHKQICDNFSQCPAMIACRESSLACGREPAIFSRDGQIYIKKENCIGCRLCLDKCGLFRIVENLYEELYEQEEFDADPRNNMNMSAERFGCDIIDRQAHLLNDLSEVKTYIYESTADMVNILELVDESIAMCPFQAIEVDYIRRRFKILGAYKKYVISKGDIEAYNELEKLYHITQFPAIILLFNGEILGDPIVTEYRIRQENQRNRVQLSLENEFRWRLQAVLG